MEEQLTALESDGRWSDAFGRALAMQRERVRDFVGLHGERLDVLEAELAKQVDQLRRDLAGEQHKGVESLAAIDQRRTEIEAAEAELRQDDRALAQLRRDHEADIEALARERQRMLEKLAELERERDELDARRARTKAQRRRIARQFQEARQAQRQEFERRAAELEQAEERLAGAPAAPEQAEQLADMRRRYDMAMDDLRELKKRNSQLEKPLAGGQPAAEGRAAGEPWGWEAQKRRMLAALEASGDAADKEGHAERLKIKEVIRHTEAVVAAKEREIAELQRLLEERGESASSAAGRAALTDVLSHDEVLQAERQRLKQLQTEWEEKLRQAEIELSVERAKIARDRAEIDERERAWQQEQAQRGAAAGDRSPPGQAPKPVRGRWLARLGLKEQGEV